MEHYLCVCLSKTIINDFDLFHVKQKCGNVEGFVEDFVPRETVLTIKPD